MIRKKFWSIPIFILAMALTAFAGVRLSPALAQGCPRPNEDVKWSERKGNTIIHHCGCKTGYDRYAGACVKAVCAKHQWKLKQAYDGAASAGSAVGFEKGGVLLKRNLEVLKSILQEPDLIALIKHLTRLIALSSADDVLYIQAIRDVESDIDRFLLLYGGRPTDNKDVWTAIKNLRNFRRLIKKTKVDLKLGGCIK